MKHIIIVNLILSLMLKSFGVFAQNDVSIPTNYTTIDEHVKNTPKEATQSIEKLADYLTSISSDPFLRLRAIYKWTAENIGFDCG